LGLTKILNKQQIDRERQRQNQERSVQYQCKPQAQNNEFIDGLMGLQV
jgi:hypothetical protein